MKNQFYLTKQFSFPGPRKLIPSCLVIIIWALSSCTSIKGVAKANEVTIDPVCNMRITDISEAYFWKYKDKTYYFDTNTCKEAFKMNPEKFINNTCNQVK